MPEITLPNGWEPRPYQLPLWGYFENGGKRGVAVWHRRAGKDSCAVNLTCAKAHERVGTYWHMLPEARQGRKVIWDAIDKQGRRIIDQAFPEDVRESTNDTEMRIRLKCGSVWQVVGSDNYNSLVGANPVGIVFSEYSIANPAAYDYVRPILRENGGWALFIYTARGRNHGAELFEMAAANPNWFAQRLTITDTGVLTEQDIAEERAAGMSEDMIQQEFYCSFDAGVVGAYYSPQMQAAEADKRITRVPHEPQTQVHTVWDLGIGDSTAIWFVQFVGKEIRLIDFLENSGVGLPWYAGELMKRRDDRQYIYGEHVGPHDANVKELGTGLSRVETLAGLGIRMTVQPAQQVADGINAARMILPKCWFDAEKCKRGIEALRNYRREYDEKRKVWHDRPLHDWSSHAADAFRYLALQGPMGASSWGAALTYPNMGVV